MKPFYVRSIWHDGQFTYIKSDAQELRALYEVKDGQPAVVNFQVQRGTYVVPKGPGRQTPIVCGITKTGCARWTSAPANRRSPRLPRSAAGRPRRLERRDGPTRIGQEAPRVREPVRQRPS